MEASIESAEQIRKQASKFEVYQRESLKLGRGDLVRITSNGKTKDAQHPLHNGMTYRIQSFTKRGDIVLTNDWTIDRDYGFLASGYVSTSHSAQGKTVDRVLIAESAMSYPAVDQAQFYVSVSRGRKQAEIYTEDSSALREAAQKLDGRVSATELMNDSQPPRILRFERQQAEVKRETQREQELEAVNDRG